LAETVEFTVAWYRAFLEEKTMADVSSRQIDDYMGKALTRGVRWAKQ